MTRSARWIAVIVGVSGLVVAVVLSRSAHPAEITAAAGAAKPVAVAAADVPVLSVDPAPAVDGASAWLNSAPLTTEALRGKVVLYEFWTFGCINCQHTLGHVKAWYQRYARDGLAVVAIHTPEFSYEADAGNVADYVSTNDIQYPVALDPEHTIWKRWSNHAWPAFYLYDSANHLRVRHLGEGSYDTTENAIRVLLGVDPQSPRAVVT